MKTVFVHPERCIGCKQCETACAVAHSLTQNLFLAVFESPAPRSRIHAEPGLAMNTAYPNKCRHCNPAPCQLVCPTAAIYRAEEFPEVVLTNSRKCIACGMCALVCPFDAITFYATVAAPEKPATAIKCDQCVDRLHAGGIPACVESCKVQALEFGEINALVKSARTRNAQQVLQAATAGSPDTETSPAIPATVESWRDWGSAVTKINANGRKERQP